MRPHRLLVLLGVSALLASGLSSPSARANLVQPDSIVRPPPGNVGSADGSAITSVNDLVTTQYTSQGLFFPTPLGGIPGLNPTTAVTRIGSGDVWVPANHTEAVAGRVAAVNYSGKLTIDFVQPGTLNPATVKNVTVEVVGGYGILTAFDAGGHVLNAANSGKFLPGGGELLTLSSPGIASITINGPIQPQGSLIPGTPWGVSSVSYNTPAKTPEPGSLVLACLGGLGVAARWRRARRLNDR
jgi:hypothetical protein